jgi:hypothetical protein
MADLIINRLNAIHEALERAGFVHAVGGAISLAARVSDPRATSDIDLNISAEASEAAAVLRSLPEEIEIPEDAISTIESEDQIRLFWPHPDTPVDLFFIAHPTFHRLVNERAERFDFGGTTPIKVMTATDLNIFKILFNRSQDWVDIEVMLR